jgi:transglutaminase-like putative cysteine protease
MSRVFRFLQLEGGWLLPALLLVLVLLPVFSLNDAAWIDRTQEFVPLAVLGAVTGVLLAKSRLNRFIAVPLGFLLMLGIPYVWFGQLLPPRQMITDNVSAFGAWIGPWWQNETIDPNPLSALVKEIIDRNSYMAGRLWEWIAVGTEGGYSSDNFVFFFLLALLIGAVSFYTAWILYRYRNGLIAVLPIGIFLIVNSFLSNRGMSFLIIYVVTTLILLMAANLASLQRLWRKKDVDYSTEMSFDLTLFAVQISAVLAIVALGMPHLRANPIASTYWTYASRPWGEVETLFNRLFSGVNNPNPDLGTGSKGALVLGGSFERPASSPVYMYVSTNETILTPEEIERTGEPDLGPPQHYWRGETWDFYTGRGWDHSSKVTVDRTASQLVTDYVIPGAVTVRQEIEIVAPRADLLYATNQPQEVSQPYRYLGLGEGDFSALYLKRALLSAAKYMVTSTVPYLGGGDLRTTTADYPASISEYYLQLPKSLPPRVTELATHLTVTSTNRYDSVIAIQNYLRQLPYDTNIKLPSTGTYDAVDYFLFIQKGYCDYFGTVMAVMLRSIGIPARLATGYLPGVYDYGNHRYEVSERDGHAWVEVYFPPYGWVDFEPTPAYAAIFRPEASLLSREPFTMPTFTPTVAKRSWWPLDLHLPANLSFLKIVPILFALFAFLGLLWALSPLLERRMVTSAFVTTIYGRMCRYAEWAGVVQPLSATPNEYARTLGAAVRRAPSSLLPWRRRRKPASLQPLADPAEHIDTISKAYVAMRYSPHAPTAETRGQVLASWQAVKGRLWSLVAGGAARRILRLK